MVSTYKQVENCCVSKNRIEELKPLWNLQIKNHNIVFRQGNQKIRNYFM